MKETKNIETMKTTIKRDTDYSFIKTTTNENGEEYSRKLEKGNVDYSNACTLFHSKGMDIAHGNEIALN